MPRRKASDYEYDEPRRTRPALTPEARESLMISLAMDLVEERMRNGTASSQEVTHFLKLGTQKEMLEREKLQTENKLLEAKIKSLESQSSSAALFEEALRAFTSYSGGNNNNDDNEEENI